MQQRRQLQAPDGKVNNDLCQPRSIRGEVCKLFNCKATVGLLWKLLGLQLLQSNVNCQNFRSTTRFAIVVQTERTCKQTPIGRRCVNPPSNKVSCLWANCLTVLARWQSLQKEACCNVQTFPFVQNLAVLACKKYSKFFENFAEKCLTYFLRCSIIYRLSA